MSFIIWIWIIIIGYLVFTRASKENNINRSSSTDTTSSPRSINTTPPISSTTRTNSNVYGTRERDRINDELSQNSVESLESIKTLYEAGIISREEYKEYKQQIR